MKAQGKDTKSRDPINWTKVGTILVLLICVVGFTLNMGFFSLFKSAQAGSQATVDYTIRDDEGRAILTSDGQVAIASYQNEEGVFYTTPLQLVVGSEQEDYINGVDVYVTDGENAYAAGTFALFSSELDLISSEIEGMKVNERKTVSLDEGTEWERTLSQEEYEQIGGNFTTTAVGDYVPLGFVDAPIITVDNATPEIATRWAKVIAKNESSIDVKYGYATVDITLTDIAR